MLGCAMRSSSNFHDEPKHPKRAGMRTWTLLLLLPYLGLCVPEMYMRAKPTPWGFPFFYWYQFAWVILAAGIMGFVYRKLEGNSLR